MSTNPYNPSVFQLNPEASSFPLPPSPEPVEMATAQDRKFAELEKKFADLEKEFQYSVNSKQIVHAPPSSQPIKSFNGEQVHMVHKHRAWIVFKNKLRIL